MLLLVSVFMQSFLQIKVKFAELVDLPEDCLGKCYGYLLLSVL